MSGEGSGFKASAQAHPSLLDVKDAEGVRIPHCVLPSRDEVPEVSCFLERKGDLVRLWRREGKRDLLMSLLLC